MTENTYARGRVTKDIQLLPGDYAIFVRLECQGDVEIWGTELWWRNMHQETQMQHLVSFQYSNNTPDEIDFNIGIILNGLTAKVYACSISVYRLVDDIVVYGSPTWKLLS